MLLDTIVKSKAHCGLKKSATLTVCDLTERDKKRKKIVMQKNCLFLVTKYSVLQSGISLHIFLIFMIRYESVVESSVSIYIQLLIHVNYLFIST